MIGILVLNSDFRGARRLVKALPIHQQSLILAAMLAGWDDRSVVRQGVSQ